MKLLSFEKCVRAITETIAQQDPLPTTSEGTVAVVGRFLMATHARMPDYMRFASWILVMIFDAWSYPTSGRPFHRLDIRRRSHQLEGWEQSRMGFQRSLIALFRALVTFGLSTERDKSG
jgi:hypothetical protein